MSKLDQLKALGDAKRAARKSSDGREKSRVSADKATRRAPISGPEATRQISPASPSEVKSKRGRPRIGEVRDKPWLKCVPPMSKTTWYRRKKENRNDSS